jgi:hypothetical protein
VLGNKRAQRNSARYKCQAGHDSWVRPSVRLQFEDGTFVPNNQKAVPSPKTNSIKVGKEGDMEEEEASSTEEQSDNSNKNGVNDKKEEKLNYDDEMNKEQMELLQTYVSALSSNNQQLIYMNQALEEKLNTMKEKFEKTKNKSNTRATLKKYKNSNGRKCSISVRKEMSRFRTRLR